MIIKAPWTDGQVQALNAWQSRHDRHPFICTCGEVLVASEEGWYCLKCSYKQDWCHDFMVFMSEESPAMRKARNAVAELTFEEIDTLYAELREMRWNLAGQ